jgi:integrase
VRPNCSDVYHKLITYTLEKFREPLAEQGIVTTGQLRRQHFSDFASAMQDKGNKPKSIHNDLAILKRAVQWGIDEGWLEPNLIRSFPSIRVPKTRRRSLSKEEIEQLIRATDGIELLDPILVALYTGARRGEVVLLLCSDVDLKLGLIRFRAEITKAGEHGDIPIHPRIRPLLEKRALDSGVLLKHASGEPWSRDELSRRFTALTKGKLGWGDVTFHCLRHTFGTQLAASGKVSPFELQRLMRHRSITTSMIYVDLGQQVLPNINVF